MFKYTRILWLALSLMLSSHALARSDIPLEKGAVFLIDACREVVDIYDARGKEKILAAQRTSLAEGIRTGYCIGVVVQYREHADYCRYSKRNVLEMAQAIANSNLTVSQLRRTSTSDLLEEAYCGL